ncbi:MAG TPA: beta-N-acetylhexosaminidase [Ignavibacteriales bacterium]|nr:beta-N-acetylhexosaminidase [Ignavibacteriales bacterium]
MKIYTILLFYVLTILYSFELFAQPSEINIIPAPKSIMVNEGAFNLNASTKIYYEKKAQPIADYLKKILTQSTGFDFAVSEWNNLVDVNSIIISLTNSENQFGKEGYTLVVNTNNVMIEAAELNGLFYGVQSLRQLLPPEIESTSKAEKVIWRIPGVVILDAPEFSWRGLNLDCCRHFMNKEFIKRYIDLLAYHKFNVLHWHLTEDQAWRIEIKKYPELTKKGAFRTYDDGSVYGGFYTQEDVKEVVDYAASRFINVVPEIEMPGHSTAAISCYPEISCTGGPFDVGTLWGIYHDIYCAGNEKTFEFLENVINEVVDLFPGRYIHVGGDEAPKDRWKECPKCQQRIKDEGLADEHELQSYFIKRMEKFINSKGKKIVGWDEILEGGLAPEATVQSWRGLRGAIDAAKQGHDVIVSPTSNCYFDYSVDVTDMQKVYLFDPVPQELTAAERKHVLGSEANMWSEYAPQELIDDRLFPRMLALSEVVWTYPTERNFEEFRQRVQRHYDRLDVLGINYGLETKPFEIKKLFNPPSNEFEVNVTQLQKDLQMNIGSFNRELLINQESEDEYGFTVPVSEIIKLSFERNKKPVGKNFIHGFTFNKATRKKVSLTYPFSEKYTAGGIEALTDGLRGSDSFRGGDKSWQGYQGTDFEAIVDLEKTQVINKISVGFFQASSSWVIFPEYVEYYTSEDGIDYTNVGRVDVKSSLRNPDWVQNDIFINLQPSSARYVKIFAKNLDKLPPWHPEAGGKPWLMIDEIIVE